ncbi:ABC-type cobalamin/Fe3+-siderophore transport system, ATPase component [Saprospira grandis DSM 2844]|uniref:ABC-type cobalamin/Fe3+-siderophore transport system, ATPase component n=1 Tax=Saprospira grandis DSM 2844 TaxID=694433 RepID=J0P570_9BACT|nr:AAA family ATPase [Saprospira grandis]EJF52587.1 ABC-type cobalamin/Fe3+-siderophore transport system, ATPase component [Saprospira grandis DSM 2844]
MIRINHIHIDGFKDSEDQKDIQLARGPITVIYGENGSGKTTLLQLLFAFLNKDELTLNRQQVQKIEINYTIDGLEKVASAKNISTWTVGFEWNNWEELTQIKSIFLSVMRSSNESKTRATHDNQHFILGDFSDERDLRETLKKLEQLLFEANKEQYLGVLHSSIRKIRLAIDDFYHNYKMDFKGASPKKLLEILNQLDLLISIASKKGSQEFSSKLQELSSKLQHFCTMSGYSDLEPIKFEDDMSHIPHYNVHQLSANEISKILTNYYKAGQEQIRENINLAFFDTIEKAIEIETEKNSFDLPKDFNTRIARHADYILQAVQIHTSSLADKVRMFLKEGENAPIPDSKIFRALLLEVLKSAEQKNLKLEAIEKLQEVFNSHLYKGKKLIITKEQAYISIKENRGHTLQELSSGEKQLLNILTFILLLSRERKLILIDEPEISLNIKWQRNFIPLLQELNQDAQIIVASHSPSIAYKKTETLVELL